MRYGPNTWPGARRAWAPGPASDGVREALGGDSVVIASPRCRRPTRTREGQSSAWRRPRRQSQEAVACRLSEERLDLPSQADVVGARGIEKGGALPGVPLPRGATKRLDM